jgi:hypothetical protein
MATRKKPKYLEAAAQRLFVKRWRLDPRTRDLPATAVPNGVRTSPIQAALAKADGMEAGVPDWLLFQCEPVKPLTKVYCEWDGLALEFKSPTGKGRVSPAQQQWHERLRDNGWRVEIVTSAEDAWRIVCDYLGLED